MTNRLNDMICSIPSYLLRLLLHYQARCMFGCMCGDITHTYMHTPLPPCPQFPWPGLTCRPDGSSSGYNLTSISSCSLVIPLFFDINAKRIQYSQWVTPFVFNQISSGNLMGFIAGDWFVKDTALQSVAALLLMPHTVP